MRALHLLVITLTAGCSTPAPQAPAPDPADAKVAFYDVMHRRLAALQAMHESVIHADLAKAAAAAETVQATALDESLPPAWVSAAKDLEAGVATVRSADSLVVAAAGTAQVAAACSACHEAAQARVMFEPPPHPKRDAGVREHMARHGVAAQAMYQGLVANLDGHWAQGVTFLAQGPLEEAELPDGNPLSPEARELEALVHGLAATAQTAESRADRTRVLAELLASCATCHALTRPLTRAPEGAATGTKEGAAPQGAAAGTKEGAAPEAAAPEPSPDATSRD